MSCAVWPFNQFTNNGGPDPDVRHLDDGTSTKPGAARMGASSRLQFDPSDVCFAVPLTEARIDRSQPRDFQKAKQAFDRGLRLQQDGQHPDALVEFQRALRADQTFGLAHLEAAISHMYTDHDAAERPTCRAACSTSTPASFH
ncbi:MAG: hypothetical protein AAFN74_11580, partial [Myxococcota bacterium]